MDIDYSVPGDVSIMIIDYLRKVILESSENIKGRTTTLDADHLFQVTTERDKKILDQERTVAFHHVVSQLIFATPNARKEIHTSVAFLNTRVRYTGKYYWKNTRPMLKYTQCTTHMPLIPRIDIMNFSNVGKTKLMQCTRTARVTLSEPCHYGAVQ